MLIFQYYDFTELYKFSKSTYVWGIEAGQKEKEIKISKHIEKHNFIYTDDFIKLAFVNIV